MGEPADLAIQTHALAKRFRRRTAVAGIDLAVPRGSVFGFLGPNGAGKTTTIRMLLGLIAPTSGEVRVLGEAIPARAARVLPRVGALVEGPAFYPFLTGEDNLQRLDAADPQSAPATRHARIAAALARVGLSAAADRKVRAYSLGMKQRLGIAQALLAPRDLLVLDEPTNGLDPQGTREVRGLIRSLAADGTTVFVSSHLLSEIEQVCSHAGIMSAGQLVAQGPLEALRAGGGRQISVTTPDARRAHDVLARLGLGVAPTPADDAGTVTALQPDTPVAAEEIVAQLVAAGVRVRAFGTGSTSLEDRFVALTGEGFDVR